MCLQGERVVIRVERKGLQVVCVLAAQVREAIGRQWVGRKRVCLSVGVRETRGSN